jgi:Xaa-Pro aminopeptidase
MASLPFTAEEYHERQLGFFGRLSNDSLVIIPTNRTALRSNDVHYPFRPSSYMLYLCGWTESDGVLVAHNESGNWITSLFVKPRDTKAEIWEGVRIGPEGAAAKWPVDQALPLSDLENFLLDKMAKDGTVYSIEGLNDEVDRILNGYKDISDPRKHLDKMRVIKSDREVSLIRESAEIACAAHSLAIASATPGMGEWQIQSIIEGYFIDRMSCWSYPSIVGGGDNATILHYSENSSVVNDGDLVLVDAGCEIHGYASDITRTWPVNGAFNEAQREIYDLVLEAQIAGIRACQPGSPWLSMHQATSQVLAQGLIDLGVLDCSLTDALGNDFDGPFRNYFMHGTGHLLGLDVHDVGGGRQGDDDPGPILQPGMVFTVEPGLYFASWRSDVEIPKRFSGIGVRIEDNVLITANGPEVLTSACPKGVAEIEDLINS